MGHPLQIIRVKKVTGNLNVLWLINTSYSKMLAIIGPIYKELVDFGRWGNPLRWDNPTVHLISHFNLNQEPISWNEQLPQRFHGPVSFQNGFGANLGHPLSPTNPSAKHTDLKKIIFAFSVNDATFSFLISLYFECVHSVVIFHFRVKNRPIRLTQCCTQFKHWTKKRIYLYSKFGAYHLQMPHLLNFAQFCYMT